MHEIGRYRGPLASILHVAAGFETPRHARRGVRAA